MLMKLKFLLLFCVFLSLFLSCSFPYKSVSLITFYKKYETKEMHFLPIILICHLLYGGHKSESQSTHLRFSVLLIVHCLGS